MLRSYAGAGPGEECFAPFRGVLGLPDLCEWRSRVTATRATRVTATRASRRHTRVTVTRASRRPGARRHASQGHARVTATRASRRHSRHGDTRVTATYTRHSDRRHDYTRHDDPRHGDTRHRDMLGSRRHASHGDTLHGDKCVTATHGGSQRHSLGMTHTNALVGGEKCAGLLCWRAFVF